MSNKIVLRSFADNKHKYIGKGLGHFFINTHDDSFRKFNDNFNKNNMTMQKMGTFNEDRNDALFITNFDKEDLKLYEHCLPLIEKKFPKSMLL